MSLTLFPITALLLLLSGVGTPVHAAGYRETIAALRKQFLGSADALPRRTLKGNRSTTEVRQIAGTPSAPALVRGSRLPMLPVHAAIPRSADRKQYRTRFGFAEGAYLAIGPPDTGIAADFG